MKLKYKIRETPERRITTLAKICKAKGMTQRQLALSANLSFSLVCKIWNGEQNSTTMTTMRKICNVVNKNMHQVFGD